MRIVLAISMVLAASLSGQTQPASSPANSPATPSDDTIATDRPAVAASSVVVPVGSLQFENGFLETGSQGQRIFDGPETAIRFGVASNFELRFSAPDYFYDSNGAATGFGDIEIGMKRQLGPVDGFDVSLIVFLSMPTGAHAVSSHGYDPGVQLPWSRKLSDNWTAEGQLAMYFPTQVISTQPSGSTQTSGRNVTGESTLALDRQLTKPMDAFIEYAGDFPERGGPRHLLHFGAAYKIGLNQQIDVHYGVGLSAAAPHHIIGVGYSFRFQALHR